MSKRNDSSAIKLFGKMIPLLTLADHHELSFREAAREDCCDRNLPCSSNSLAAMNSNDGVQAQALREDKESIEKEFHNKPSAGRETSSLEISKNEEKCETNASQEKTLKKPDKLLPCPRCNSKETKFCYYNNYNVNQPRHFCKKCQRYWTAGGAMRNVPVGAGRRKTKGSSALHYHYIEAMIRAVEASPTNGIHQNPETNNNSCVITFGSESSVNISGKPRVDVQKGVRKPQQGILVEDNHSGESLITASYCLDQKASKANLSKAENKSYQFFPSKVPCLTGPPRPYPWGSIHCSTAMLPPLPPRTLFPPGSSAPTYRPSPWDVPVASPSPAPSSSPTSPALGKHSRDEKIFNPANIEKEKLSGSESNKSERRALNSKILRIDDDPVETAKSSMLATLMIKTKDTNSINPGGLFDGFQSKISYNRNYRPGTTTTTFSVLRANPVALSRSINFHENT